MKKTLVLCLSLLFPAMVGAQGVDLCSGLIQDKALHPMTQIAPPTNIGDTIIDPEFGTTIRRITKTPNNAGDSFIKPLYSPVQAWNVDESMFILYHGAGANNPGWNLYNGTTYARIKNANVSPGGAESLWWSGTEPGIIYWARPTDHQFVKTDVLAVGQPITVLHDFTNEGCSNPYPNGGALYGDAHTSGSNDGDLYGLVCGQHTFSYRVSTNTSITTDPSGYAAFALASGAGFVTIRSASHYRVTDDALVQIGVEMDVPTPSHYALGRDEDGRDIFCIVQFDGGPQGSPIGTVCHYADTDMSVPGSNTLIMGPANGWPYPRADTHISATAIQNYGWIAQSHVGGCNAITFCPNVGGSYNTRSPTVEPNGQDLLDNEITIANVNTGVTCRVGHHRSLGKYNNALVLPYWAEPHVTMSRTGTRLIFASDWGAGEEFFAGGVDGPELTDPPTVDTYVIELPSYGAAVPPSISTTTLPAGTVGVAYSQQISVQGGVKPYTACAETVGALPTGLTSEPNALGCLIAGTPSVANTFNFTEEVTDSTPVTPLTDTQALTIVITSSLTINTSGAMNSGEVGIPYSQQILVTGGTPPYTACAETVGALPAGLTSEPNGSGCLIAGTPTVVGDYSFTEQVTDNVAGTDTENLSISITNEPVVGIDPTVQVQSGATYAIFHVGGIGMPRESSCYVTVTDLDNVEIETQTKTSGYSRRNFSFEGLTPNTSYSFRYFCTGTVPDVQFGSFQTRTDDAQTRPVKIVFGPPNSIVAAQGGACLLLNYGVAAVGENSTSQACASGCTFSLDLNQDLYIRQHSWKAAGCGGSIIARSAIVPMPVE